MVLAASSADVLLWSVLRSHNLVELAIERRPTDIERARRGRHTAMVVFDMEANHVGLALLQRLQLTVLVEEADGRKRGKGDALKSAGAGMVLVAHGRVLLAVDILIWIGL
ncbi:MAG: hypothetical protein Athens041674_249 [Parcubacteria group bacterium Athens0416_74]|nr:MAG: hypothetical protein Athens041674_249 [Parcubacteria group bacterium Athens0416_74]